MLSVIIPKQKHVPKQELGDEGEGRVQGSGAGGFKTRRYVNGWLSPHKIWCAVRTLHFILLVPKFNLGIRS